MILSDAFGRMVALIGAGTILWRHGRDDIREPAMGGAPSSERHDEPDRGKV